MRRRQARALARFLLNLADMRISGVPASGPEADLGARRALRDDRPDGPRASFSMCTIDTSGHGRWQTWWFVGTPAP